MYKCLLLASAGITAILFAAGFIGKIYMLPVAFVLAFAVLFLFCVLFCVICTCFVDTEKPCRKQNRVFRFFTYCIIHSIIKFFGIRLYVSGTENLPSEKFLLVGNHRSAFDPLLTMGALHQKIGFVAKKELFDIPVLREIMHKRFCLPLDWGSKKQGLHTCLSAIDIIKSGVTSMGIYPEGATNRGNELLPFKNGAFKIAQKAKCPIVVAVIENTDSIKKNAPFRKTDVYLNFVGTLDSEFVSSAKTEQISDTVRKMIEHSVHHKSAYDIPKIKPAGLRMKV